MIREQKNYKLNSCAESFLETFFSEVKDTKELKTYKVISRGSSQINFRNEIIKAYNEKCCITGSYCKIDDKNLLEAAHIIPISHGGSYEVNNGLLMTANLHKLFDIGGISFDDDYNICISSRLKNENYLPKMKCSPRI